MESKKLDNPILKQLLFEKNNNIKGGLYQRTLIKFLDTKHDFIEVQNVSKCFDYLLDTIDQALNQDLILTIHNILKFNSKYWKVDGKYYKKYPNHLWKGKLFKILTIKPVNVELEINRLLGWYNSLKKYTLDDILNLDMFFLLIHPFQDGNGRVSRFLMFRECLRNDIIPFVIDHANYETYLNGIIDQYRICDEKSILNLCKKLQENYKNLIIFSNQKKTTT